MKSAYYNKEIDRLIPMLYDDVAVIWRVDHNHFPINFVEEAWFQSSMRARNKFDVHISANMICYR